MKSFFIKLSFFLFAATLILSCENSDPTDYEEKLTLFCYAKADSTIDSLYLMRTGGVNEHISLEDLAVSGAVVVLYEKPSSSEVFLPVDTLVEYPDRRGVYYLPSATFPAGFRTDYFYRIVAEHPSYETVYAETVCPPSLRDIAVWNSESGKEMTSIGEDPFAVDTLYYRRGESFDDHRLVLCSFDSIPIILESRIASYRLVPDEICRTDTSFWLEDTTETVWEDYPEETKLFKDRERYGSDFFEYYLRSIKINWYALYHEGMHTLIFSETDQAFRFYMETLYGGEERYSNVVNGLGLFSLSNSSAEKSRYRIFVKSLENKYP